MSTKVAILCEDHTNDQYILQPIVTAALRHIGVPRPQVTPITNPRMTGFVSLLQNLCDVITRYHNTVGAVVVCFDIDGEDGQEGRADKAARVRHALQSCTAPTENVVLLGSVMEAEVYALWGARANLSDSWTQVRSERDPKEAYFDTLIRREDLLTSDGGRDRLTKASLSAGWASVSGGCPELGALAQDLRAVLRR